jgi:hypothetical protein
MLILLVTFLFAQQDDIKLLEFKIEGTPGRDKTFLIINPGAALEGL